MGIAKSYRGPSGMILPGLRMDIKEALEKLRNLFQRKGVTLAYLFGSYVHDEAGTTSDIDIAILPDRSKEGLYSSYRELMLGV